MFLHSCRVKREDSALLLFQTYLNRSVSMVNHRVIAVVLWLAISNGPVKGADADLITLPNEQASKLQLGTIYLLDGSKLQSVVELLPNVNLNAQRSWIKTTTNGDLKSVSLASRDLFRCVSGTWIVERTSVTLQSNQEIE